MKRVAALITLIVAAVMGVHAQADGVANWRADYYNNIFLTGTPVVRNVDAVSFDWQGDSPAPGINADNFSVRFSARVAFTAGTYRFFARADDEVRVTVDNQIIINTLDNPRIGEVIAADVGLSSGLHDIRVDYRERTGDAFVFVTWQNTTDSDPEPTFPPLTRESAALVDVGPWIVQYYGNDSLSGFPTAIFSTEDVSNNWGEGAPVASVPVDLFSARWTASPTLEGGLYRVSARADDGVRVFVNGDEVIDLWEGRVDQLGTADVNLPQGQHNFVVEYREERVDAYIEFSVASLEEVEVAPPPVQAVKVPSNQPVASNATGTIDAFRLNVRAAPTTDASILVKVERGETHPIVGRNADDSWWQINVDGTVGWVFADFLIPVNTAGVPITSSSSQTLEVTSTGLRLTATGTVNLRSSPSRAGAVLGLLPQGAQADILGRNSTGTWIQVNYNGTIAWVSASFVNLPVSTSEIPLSST